MPGCYAQLLEIRDTLEKHYEDMQDIEFTIERGTLYMLQTRTGKRTGLAALNIAFDFKEAGVIDTKTLLQRVEADMLVQLLAPIFDAKDKDKAKKAGRVLGKGLPAGPGAASGEIAFSAARAVEMAAKGKKVLLARAETSPEDLAGMVAAVGILTSRGGMTSHAAVVARGMGKPCVVGAESIRIDTEAKKLTAAGKSLKEGDAISIDGATGEVILGPLDPHPSEIQQVLVEATLKGYDSPLYGRYAQLLRWADDARKLKVRTNADTPHDAEVARASARKASGSAARSTCSSPRTGFARCAR
jgi:pyruvate,orthophosphate dikinase